MITYKTTIKTYPYDFSFTVLDDKDKFATIEVEEEWGVSGDICSTWEECLANAVLKAKEFENTQDIVFSILFHDVISDKRLFMNKLRELSMKGE